MASHLTSVHFTVRAVGEWHAADGRPPDVQQPATAARDHLRRRIADVLQHRSVLHLAAAEDATNTVVGCWKTDAGLQTRGRVHLAVPTEDRSLAEELLRRRQAADLDHEAQLYRLTRLQHLLADPDLRRVWWIDRFPEQHGELSGLITVLHDLPVPQEAEDDGIRGDIRRFTERLITDLHTPQQREIFLHALIQALKTLGHHDLTNAATHWQTASETGSATA